MHGRKTFWKRLQNLRNSKGSVLFLVIAIMSVLMIMASAVYYSINSAHKQTEARYKREQAYQSAISLVDVIEAKVESGAINVDNLTPALIKGQDGGSMRTDTTADSSIAGGLGDYKVDITRIDDGTEDGTTTIRIDVTIDVNGEKQTVTSFGELKTKTKPFTFDRFFTSTGYAPNDVVIKSFKTDGGTLYFDNEYTQIGGNNAHDLTVKVDKFINAGTLRLDNGCLLQSANGLDLTVGNNLYYCCGDQATALKANNMIIGGSLFLASFDESNNKIDDSTTPFVNGDCFYGNRYAGKALYVNGDMVYSPRSSHNTEVYVNGDLFIGKDKNVPSAKIAVGGNVYVWSNAAAAANNLRYVGGKIYEVSTGKVYSKSGAAVSETGTCDKSTDQTLCTFDLNSNNATFLGELGIRNKMDEIQTLCGTGTGAYQNIWKDLSNPKYNVDTLKNAINEDIGNPEYINWDLEDKFTDATKDDDGKVVDRDLKTDVTKLDLKYSSGEEIKVISAEEYDPYLILGNIDPKGGRNALVFDTYAGTENGVDKWQDFYVYLVPNCTVSSEEKIVNKEVYNAWSCNGTVKKLNSSECTKQHPGGDAYNGGTSACDVCGAMPPSSAYGAKQNWYCSACGQEHSGKCPKGQSIPDWAIKVDAWQCSPFCSEKHEEGVAACPICGTTAESFGIAKQMKSVKIDKGVTKGSPDTYNAFMWNPNSSSTAFTTLIRGQGSVVFVIPDGVTYIQNEGGFLGHIGVYEQGVGVTVNVTGRGKNSTYSQLPKDRYDAGGSVNGKLKAIIDDNGHFTQTIIDTYKTKQHYIHNNVFLITISKNADMDFSGSQNAIGAIMYAPYMSYTPDGIFAASENCMFGGLIVSDYVTASRADYCVFSPPYDYYDRFVDKTAPDQEKERARYMEKLMADSGCETLLGAATDRGWRKFGYN